ncbi:hypothetical protein Gotur_028210, partial [Gossypium turneri]
PTSAIISKANVSLPIHSSQLVEIFCNGKAIQHRMFCLKALSTPKVITALDTTQLGTLIMKLGAANAKATLNVYNEIIKKPGSPQALKALKCCIEGYRYAILSFEMVSSELVEDPRTANYDVAVIVGDDLSNLLSSLLGLQMAQDIEMKFDAVYTNRAVTMETGFATAEGVTCKQNREWIHGYNHYLGSCSIF